MKYCPRCKQTKPFTEFYKAKERKDGYRNYCKDCGRIAHNESYHRNKNGGWSDKSVEDMRRNNIRARYGLTVEQYEAIVSQDKCEICKEPGVQLHLDHCHVTGKVRGGLCHRCNTGLGLLQDSPDILQSALFYLQAHKEDEVA